MTDIQHIDVDSEEFENAPRALRDHVKKLQTALSESNQQITDFRSRETERVLGDVLAAQGFKNPKRVQRDLLSDKIDPLDEAAVKAWLEENSDDYAKGEPQPAADATQQQPDPASQQADYDRLNVGSEFRQPASKDKVDSVLAEITPDMDGAAVARLYAERGI